MAGIYDKNISVERHFDHEIEVNVKFEGKTEYNEDTVKVEIRVYLIQVDNTRRHHYSVHCSIEKQDYIKKFLFFKKPNPVSFKSQVMHKISSEVDKVKRDISARRRNSEMTENFPDSLENL